MKILEIDSCFDCKHLHRDLKHHLDYCIEIEAAVPFDVSFDAGEGIPDWCPLPDNDKVMEYIERERKGKDAKKRTTIEKALSDSESWGYENDT